MDSFITWRGGKKLLRKRILEQFPPTEQISRYIEVFGGAGWVLFGKEQGKHLEVFNDLDGDLVNLFRCVKHHRDAVQKELEYSLNAREQFLKNKRLLESGMATDIQRAAIFFHIIKVSFGGDRRTFGCNKKKLLRNIEYLREIEKRLDGVVIENKDFENLIQVYDRPDALFYLDPPYYKAEKYYSNVFTEDDHIRLRNVLQNIKGRFILSYNDDEYIRNLYSDFQIETVERGNNLDKTGKSGAYKELIVKNY